MLRHSIAFLAAFLPLSASAQEIEPALPERAPEKLSAHVYALEAWPNIGFVVGDRAVLVIDTGLGPKNGAVVARAAERLAPGKELYLTTTHYHPEHAMGEAGFPARTKIVRCTAQQTELETGGQDILTRFRRNPEFEPFLRDVTWRKPDVLFERETTLDLGGVSARLMCLGSTHTKGDLEIFVASDSVLFSGDVAMKNLFPSIRADGGSPKQWIEVLDRLAPLQPKIVIPTHGALTDGSVIAAYRAFFVDLRERALAQKAKGVPETEAKKIVNQELAAKYPTWTARDVGAGVAWVYAEN